MTTDHSGPVWTPSRSTVATANVEAFRLWLQERIGVELADYRALQRWSITELPAFWSALAEYFDVPMTGTIEQVLTPGPMPGVHWFTGAYLNYANHVARHRGPGVAIIDTSETEGSEPRSLTWDELHRQVGAVAHTLRDLGVTRGDRVVGYLPNISEAVVAFLATAALGAIWSSCGQDYSAPGAIDRLGQLEPKVLIAADGYHHAGSPRDRRAEVDEIRRGIESLEATIVVPRLGLDPLPQSISWARASAGDHAMQAVDVPFEHPLWILFSSGTTGRPKGIVHGHGGVVLEHLKQVCFHLDLGPGDRFFWYTSPSWMVWNTQVAGLLAGATIICYDGSPAHPDAGALWQLAERHGVTVLGASPAYLQACEKAGIRPGDVHDLSRLKMLGATGSVLPPHSYEWVRDRVGAHIQVASMTGGTDVVSAFAGAVPTVAVHAGEIPVISLGTALEAWDADGNAVTDAVGEMVVTKPMPSMPLYFWNDADGSRYRDAYFSTYPGVWRHGDFITISTMGSITVHGRSDSTLNRNGVRMGSADIYEPVEALPWVQEALVVGVELPDGSYWMPLFVVMHDGVPLDDGRRGDIRQAILKRVSPRHLPDDIIAAPAIPHTRTGKKLEIPIKRLIQGGVLTDVVDPKAVDDETTLQWYADFAEHQRRAATRSFSADNSAAE